MQKIDAAGAWELETNAKIILTKLGITDLSVKVGTLSGGYRKRVALATALLSEPDVLLMDEPTNHLDALSVEWLQSYLSRYRGALFLITHDRYFLDQVTNRIIEIDRGDIYTYSGNYSYYLEKKALAEESAVSTQRKHQGILRRELEWLKRGPKARSTKQKARIDRAHALRDTEFKQIQGKVDISTVSRRIGKKVIQLDNVTKAYNGRTLINNFTYEFSPEDHIGIIGSNGAGKSTLMDIITAKIKPDSGNVEIGSTIHIAYFNQHSEELLTALNENQRVIDYIKEEGEFIQIADGTKITASQMLERFLFPGNQQYAPIHKLSGGEKRRLFLLRLLIGAPNVLILDEPTNDLDVQTLAVLEDYLEDFSGCVIIVSHDRYFLDRTVDKIFALETGGNLRQYPGNYSIYLDYKKAEEALLQQDASTKEKSLNIATEKLGSSINQIEPKKRRRLSNWEKREFDQLETKISQLEVEKTTAETAILKLSGNFTQVQKLYEQVETLKQAIDVATERWLELAEMDA
jgi:ATP-binding cassette subfamily F protein uup